MFVVSTVLALSMGPTASFMVFTASFALSMGPWAMACVMTCWFSILGSLALNGQMDFYNHKYQCVYSTIDVYSSVSRIQMDT